MIVLVIEYLLTIPVTILMVGICLMLIWIYVKGLFSKSAKFEGIFHYIVWSNTIIVGWMIYSYITDFSITDYPTSLNELKEEVVGDLKTTGIVILGIAGGGVLMWLGIGLLTLCATPLYFIIKRIFNSPFKRIKIHYRRLLKSLDFIESLETESFKLRCNKFKSINSLPFNFNEKFFINPRQFDRKRKGKRYSGGYGTTPDRYKNVQEYSEESNWRYEVIINRVNYLNIFSNFSTSKKMLTFQSIVNNLYIPLTIIFSIIEYHYFNYLFCIPIIYTVFYFFVKKTYSKDFKVEYYDLKIFNLLIMVFLIPFFALFYSIFYSFIIDIDYSDNYLGYDIIFTFLIVFINLMSDLYDYIVEKFMNSIFCRILLNERLFCYFYTLKCFEVQLEEWVKIDDKSNREEKKWFFIKYDPDIDK